MVKEVPTELRTGVLKDGSSDNSWKLPKKALPADSSGETQKCIANVYKTLADGYL